MSTSRYTAVFHSGPPKTIIVSKTTVSFIGSALGSSAFSIAASTQFSGTNNDRSFSIAGISNPALVLGSTNSVSFSCVGSSSFVPDPYYPAAFAGSTHFDAKVVSVYSSAFHAYGSSSVDVKPLFNKDSRAVIIGKSLFSLVGKQKNNTQFSGVGGASASFIGGGLKTSDYHPQGSSSIVASARAVVSGSAQVQCLASAEFFGGLLGSGRFSSFGTAHVSPDLDLETTDFVPLDRSIPALDVFTRRRLLYVITQ